MIEPCSHPSYDLGMEILATLQPEPFGTPMRLLVEDFSLKNRKELWEALSVSARGAGVGVQQFAENHASCLCIKRHDAKKAKAACETYWAKVHG